MQAIADLISIFAITDYQEVEMMATTQFVTYKF